MVCQYSRYPEHVSLQGRSGLIRQMNQPRCAARRRRPQTAINAPPSRANVPGSGVVGPLVALEMVAARPVARNCEPLVDFTMKSIVSPEFKEMPVRLKGCELP